MLVLSRERDETIMIGDDIEITIVDIRGDKIRIGINAPSRVAVHRKEVYDAIRAENAQAAMLGDAEMDRLSAAIEPGPVRQKLRAVGPSGLTTPAHRITAPAGTAGPGRLAPPKQPSRDQGGKPPPSLGLTPARVGKPFAEGRERRAKAG